MVCRFWSAPATIRMRVRRPSRARSEPLTARTDLERFAVRERRSEPTELLSQYTWAQLLILEIVR